MSLISITLILFLIMDPLGNVAYFINVLSHIPPKQQRWVIVREMFIALGVIVAFYFIGDLILDFLQVSDSAVSLTSGVILFLVSIKIIFPNSKNSRLQAHFDTEPFIVPLAIPLIAGPALLATVMLFAHSQGGIVLGAIIIAWLLASLVLVSSPFLMRYLGRNGLLAIEKLMGMILILLAIQRFMEGITLFMEKNA
jgi:multiple antibiotic resistance protein